MVYFDNAATTFPKPEVVYDTMNTLYREVGVNVGRGQYKTASKAACIVEETRNLLLELFHSNNKSVVFTHTATEALNLIINSVVKDNMNVYISPFEHNAVVRPLYKLKESKNINIKKLSVDRDYWKYNLDKIQQQFVDDKPSVVIVSHASNVCGLVAPIYEIAKEAKKYDAVVLVDMCQTAGLIDTDLSTNDIDYAVFDGHKTLYGPFGIAGIISGDFLEITPLIYGGTGIDSANLYMPTDVPARFEAGSSNVLSIYGLNASIKWINEEGINKIYNQEEYNKSMLIDILSSFSNILIKSPVNMKDSISIVSCIFDDYSSENIGNILSQKDIAVRTGLHCAPFAHKFINTFPHGTVRFSTSYFSKNEDFIKLENVLKYIYDNS